ncbi:MAG: cytochrome c [Akkermansiaceae bacterium]|nr:cytochrome c [Akkermansiaceae bacterium]
MDSSRDNVIVRFTSFWWGLGTFLIFALLLAVIWLFVKKDPATLEDAAAKPRYEVKAKIDSAQAAAISPEALKAGVKKVSSQLVGSKPMAVEMPEQLVPGKPKTGASDGAPIDPAVMATGQASYLVCSACHGQNGEGGPIAPPLANSEWVTGPIENLIRIQLRGLVGPITVAGKEYNFPGGMVAQAYQTDEQIAAVLTYVRNSFGNKASAVSPDAVKALRGEVGKPQVTAAELVKP